MNYEMQIIQEISKLKANFNLSDDVCELWTNSIKEIGMPTIVLQERVNNILISWGKDEYGKPTLADIVGDFQQFNDTEYTTKQVDYVLHKMIEDRIPSEIFTTINGSKYEQRDAYFVYIPDIYNAQLRNTFEPVLSENGQTKRDREGRPYWKLTSNGKQYAQEIQQRINYDANKYLRGSFLLQRHIDRLKEMRITDASASILNEGKNGYDFLIQPFEVCEKTQQTTDANIVEYENYWWNE